MPSASYVLGSNSDSDDVAYLWEDGVPTSLGDYEANAINQRGQVAGSNGIHAVLWTRE